MIKLVSIILFLLFSFPCVLCWSLFWGSFNYPEISNVLVEKGKPIEVQETYTQLQIRGLNGTLYSDSLSKLSPVTDLKIASNQLRKIEAGSICSLPTLRRFGINFVDNNEAPVLTKDMFKNCENLEELYLTGDYSFSVKMKSDLLQDLPNLRHLYMRDLDVQHLTKDHFKGSKSLTELNLHRCFITEIDWDAFQDQKNLEEIRITGNSFSRLPLNLFKNTPKLVYLDLSNNGITALTWDEFDGLSTLKELNLEQNNITTLNADKIARSMPNLKILTMELSVADPEIQKKLAEEESKLASNPLLTYIVVQHIKSPLPGICSRSEEK